MNYCYPKNMDEFHKHKLEPKKPETEECVPYDSTYLKFRYLGRTNLAVLGQ